MLLRSISVTVLSITFLAWSQFTVDANTLALDTASLISFWTFEKSNGTTIYDSSANNRTAINHGASFVKGVIGNAIFFSDSSNYIQADSTAAYSNFSSALTFSFWINPSQKRKSQIINKWANGLEDKNVWIDTNMAVVFYLYSCFSGLSLKSKSHIPLNQWTNIATIYDGVKAYIYINGVLDTSQSASGSISNSSGTLFVGYDPDRSTAHTGFMGAIDNLRIFKRALSASEVAILFNKEESMMTQPTLVSAVANGKQVMLSFDRAVSPLAVTSLNIDSILPISLGHSWLSGFGTIDSAIWNPAGTKLLVTLSVAFSSPTISVGDSISFLLGSGKVVLSGILDLPAALQNHIMTMKTESSLEISGSVIHCSIPEHYRGDKARLDIYDLSGRVLLSSEIITKNSNSFSYPLPRLSKGCFLVSLRAGRGFYRSVKWTGTN